MRSSSFAFSSRSRSFFENSVDLEGQHRHRGAEGLALSAPAALGRSLERARDRTRIGFGEDTFLEIEGVTRSRHTLRPALARGVVADLPAPAGSGPRFRRPVVVIQCDAFNRSRIATVVCVPLTTNTRWADVPGNVVLPPHLTNLRGASVANASQVIALDKELLSKRVGKLTRAKLELVLAGLDAVLGR